MVLYKRTKLNISVAKRQDIVHMHALGLHLNLVFLFRSGRAVHLAVYLMVLCTTMRNMKAQFWALSLTLWTDKERESRRHFEMHNNNASQILKTNVRKFWREQRILWMNVAQQKWRECKDFKKSQRMLMEKVLVDKWVVPKYCLRLVRHLGENTIFLCEPKWKFLNHVSVIFGAYAQDALPLHL